MVDEIKKENEVKVKEEVVVIANSVEKSETETLKEKLSAIEKERELLKKEKEELLKEKELEKLPENEKKRQKEIDELASKKADEILKKDLVATLSNDKDFLEFVREDADDLKDYSLERLRKKEKKYKEYLIENSKKKDTEKKEKEKQVTTGQPLGYSIGKSSKIGTYDNSEFFN